MVSYRIQHNCVKVSLSGNFNKPVVVECPKEKVEDIFSSISFSSPLQDIGRSAHLYPSALLQHLLLLPSTGHG